MFEKLIAKVASSLKKYRIPYMIIGGQAVLLYGTPRLTRDIDITLGISTDKLPLASKAISDSGLKAFLKTLRPLCKKLLSCLLKMKKQACGLILYFPSRLMKDRPLERAKKWLYQEPQLNLQPQRILLFIRFFLVEPEIWKI